MILQDLSGFTDDIVKSKIWCIKVISGGLSNGPKIWVAYTVMLCFLLSLERSFPCGDSGILASPILPCHHLLQHALSAWEILPLRGQNWFLGEAGEKNLRDYKGYNT